MCHLIFLAPVLALPVFWLLPLSQALPISLAVVGATALILWPVVRAMRRPLLNGAEGMIGARGEALTALSPTGLVRCHGEVWSATADETVVPGERVWVTNVHRLKVRVTPHAPDHLPTRNHCSMSS